jgi:hypothetical protein
MISTREDRRPSFDFYFDDWLSSYEDLRLCGPAARGIWIDLICIMKKSPKRGSLLTAKGVPYTVQELANICTNADAKEMQKLLDELEQKNVFSRLSDGTIICRRDYYQAERQDQVRLARQAAAQKRWGKKKKKEPCKSSTNENANDVQKNLPRAGAIEKEEEKERFLDFVLLKRSEYQRLLDDYGPAGTAMIIDRLNNWIGQVGSGKFAKKYSSHYFTARNLATRDGIKKLEKRKPDPQPPQREMTAEEVTAANEKLEKDMVELRKTNPGAAAFMDRVLRPSVGHKGLYEKPVGKTIPGGGRNDHS